MVFFQKLEHFRHKPRTRGVFSKLFLDFRKWTFLKCPKSIFLFTFWKKFVTEKSSNNYTHIFVSIYGNNTKKIIVTINFRFKSDNIC